MSMQMNTCWYAWLVLSDAIHYFGQIISTPSFRQIVILEFSSLIYQLIKMYIKQNKSGKFYFLCL